MKMSDGGCVNGMPACRVHSHWTAKSAYPQNCGLQFDYVEDSCNLGEGARLPSQHCMNFSVGVSVFFLL